MHLLPPETPLSFPGDRIGLFGGTFNPPHRGHLEAAKTALQRLHLNRVWWMVTPGNPLKDTHALPPLKERMAWCRDLIEDTRHIVTGFEAHLPNAYTANTVHHLVQQRPETHFVWIMGGDGMVNFHHWHHWQTLAGLVPIAVIDRPGWRLKAMASRTAHYLASRYVPETKAARLADSGPPAWTYLTAPQNPLSSTELRQR